MSAFQLKLFVPALIVGFVLAWAPGLALAYSDDEPETPKCDKGFVYSESEKKCVKKTSENLSDDDLYSEAVVQAKNGDYDEALDLLSRIKDQNQARVLNYIGYSTRKKGDLDKGISFYHKALKIDPNYILAREYLGEGYLQKGLIDKAKVELGEIGKRCGTSCEEYIELAQKIDEATRQQ